MTNKKLSLAVVGAGMGGLAVAATLRRFGIDVQVYEQARALCPHRRRHPDDAELDEGAARNRHRGAAARDVLRPVLAPQPGLGHRRGHARAAHAGEPLRGALSLHASGRSARCARLGRCRRTSFISARSSLASTGGRPSHAAFADGTRATADAVVGADGVHSVVRDIIVGPDAPIHKGRIAYRAVFPSH